ncbi:putative inositol monophosphatase 3 [Rhodnius prolixus]|uniref:putative inositol monophosphatase 3 n=1 Tax=Rhodnius prolixus TaxID=13249 RepID=UPI003D187EDD
MNFGGTIRINRIGFCIICAVIILFVIYLTPKHLSFRSDKINLRRLLLASIEAAERGGLEVIKVSKESNINEEIKGKTKEGVKIPVTEADYRSHCVMYYGITKLFPSISVISEEKEGEKDCKNLVPLDIEPRGNLGIHGLPDVEVEASEITVWIDPLDATQEYTEHLYNYVTTMVCVAYRGNPIIGVIHKPFGDEHKTMWAWLNKGKSPHLIFAKDKLKENEKAVIIVSRSHHGNVDKFVKKVFGESAEIIYAGGSGYKSLEVASGNVTAYIHKTAISKWDVCAGDAIIASLGGTFKTLSNKYLDYKADSNHLNTEGILATMISNVADKGKVMYNDV